MKKVFISSTYLDLNPHRTRIWELLKSFEVEVTGMEEFGARTEKPLKTCLDEVSISDIFIGIIGMRYGSIDNETNKSFTQREYEVALEKGKEVFIYLFDEKEGKISPNLIDFENHSKLVDFKKSLQENHTVDSFVSDSDLVEKIEKKLNQIFVNKTSQIFRPEKIDSFVHRFNVSDEKYIAIVGLLYCRPIEIFTGQADYYWMPPWVNEGWLIKYHEDSGYERHDFQFEDRQGYKVTIEGISRSFNKPATQANLMMTKLLMNDTKIELILEILKDFPFGEIFDSNGFYKGIKDALQKASHFHPRQKQ